MHKNIDFLTNRFILSKISQNIWMKGRSKLKSCVPSRPNHIWKGLNIQTFYLPKRGTTEEISNESIRCLYTYCIPLFCDVIFSIKLMHYYNPYFLKTAYLPLQFPWTWFNSCLVCSPLLFDRASSNFSHDNFP